MNFNQLLMNVSSEVTPLLSMVESFSSNEIMSRYRSPEIPLTTQELKEIVGLAVEAGLLDASPSGYGFWSEYTNKQAPTFSLNALRIIAKHNVSVAVLLHTISLGNLCTQFVSGSENTPNIPLILEGRFGLGRSSLSRWLRLPVIDAFDSDLLADCYGLKDRLAFHYSPKIDILAPLFRAGKMCLCRINNEDKQSIESTGFHGFDGLHTATWNLQQQASTYADITKREFEDLLIMNTLGNLAIGLGALDNANSLVNDFVRLRKQGGHLIIQHDAIASLMATILAAIQQVGDSLHQQSLLSIQQHSLQQCLSLKMQFLPQISQGINSAMQIFGGIGYMRDQGIEVLLRNVNCLRVLSGSQAELPLVITSLHTPEAGKIEPINSNSSLPGYLPKDNELSPWRAFRKLPLLSVFSNYRPTSLWEEETNMLPKALAQYRRRLRQFSDIHVLPYALSCDEHVGNGLGYPECRNQILRIAGKEGLLNDLLPAPLGSVPLSRYRHSLVWQQAIRVEELARADGGLMLLLSAHNLGLAPVLFSANLTVLRDIILPSFRANRKGNPQVFAFAITEPAAGSDAEDGYGAQHNKPGVRATQVSGGWQLNGRKLFISGGDIARWVTVFAAVERQGFESWSAFLVDTKCPGFSVVRTENKMGMRVSGAAELELDRYFVPNNRVLGGLNKGWGLNRATLNFSRIPVAAMSVGFAQQATECAIEFACRMSLANRPLIHYQQVQLQLADMLAETAAIRSLVWRFAKNWTPRQSQASMAKFYASDRAQSVIESAMDLMANHSLMHSNHVEKTFRDNRLTRIFEGTNQINRLSVIEEQQDEFLNKIMQNNPIGRR